MYMQTHKVPRFFLFYFCFYFNVYSFSTSGIFFYYSLVCVALLLNPVTFYNAIRDFLSLGLAGHAIFNVCVWDMLFPPHNIDIKCYLSIQMYIVCSHEFCVYK